MSLSDIITQVIVMTTTLPTSQKQLGARPGWPLRHAAIPDNYSLQIVTKKRSISAYDR